MRIQRYQISEFDIFEKDKTIYHIDKVIRETGTVIDDGSHEIYVNTKIKDGLVISELMDCFMQTDFDNAKFPKASKEETIQTIMEECNLSEQEAKEQYEKYAAVTV